MTYIPPVNGGRINATISGNTAGAGALISTGTMTLAGGNNITLSQNANAITVSGAPSLSAGMSNIGNTSGTTGLVSNQLVLAGGNNITLSQSTAVGGNTITISAGGGGLTNINLSAGTTSNNLSNVVFSNSNGVSFGLNGSTMTASVNAAGGATGSYFDNMFQQNSQPGIAFTSVSTGMFGRLLLQPLSPGNELFPYVMTASTMLLGFSNSSTSTSVMSAAHTSSWYFGIYTRINSTQLSLLNSVSTSYGMAANAGNSASYMGARWLSFHSSQFSAQPVLQADSRYFFGLMVRTAGATYSPVSLAGMHLGHSVQRSGFMATASSGNNTLNAWHPFMGVHTQTTLTALPASVANTEIVKASQYANFIPQVIFDAGLGVMS